ncbi:MAG: hypothetical protein H0T71_02905 [Acidobacteria bacterium]|nr:hypothetical protein [Acidobacteriota bacterium]
MKAMCLTGLVVALVVIAAHAQLPATFSVSDQWAQLPAGTEWGPISAITSDAKGSVVVLRRTFPSVFLFTTDGEFVKSWGSEGLFNGSGAHGVRVDRDGFLWATDTLFNVIYKMTMDGTVVLQVGKRGVTGGNDSRDAFDRPADVVVAANGDFFVADGYGNSRVVKFSKDGRFIKIIGGEKGIKPGQFDLVHSIVIDSKGRLLVGDRTNARVQIFDQDGKFIEQWIGLGQPYGLYITSDDILYVGDAAGGTITIAKDGKPLDVIRDLGRPHWVTVDATGAIYMTDVRGFVKKIVRAGSVGR